MPEVAYDYTPSPVQAEAHQMVVDELLYGGAAGGGKSRWGRAEAVRMALLVPGSRTIIFRRTFADLDRSVVMPLRMEMPRGVATYSNTAHTWTFKNGSVIELAYLRRKDDVLNYQGAEYQLVIWEELTQFTEFPYRYMLTRLRAAGAVKTRMEEMGWRPRVIATANPGGPGHFWVRARWIDPAPARTVFTVNEDGDDEPATRCYMPAKAADNPHIDKSYVKRLKRSGGNLAKAMLDGDWDILEGVRFDQWRADTHVITAAQFHDLFADTGGVPLFGYPRAIGIDYGTRAPFAALWGVKLTNGTVVIYREAYEVGLTPTQQAEKILAMETDGERREDRPLPAVMDPSMWKAPDSNPLGIPAGKDLPPTGSVADFYRKVLHGNIHKARNDRIGGWSLIDEHLRVGDDGLPGLLVVETCRNLIRTLPALPRSDKNPEDLDTEAEDHACLAAGTLIATDRGQVPIEDIMVGDKVWTRKGLRAVTEAGMSNPSAAVGRVSFGDGSGLVGTADHPVWVDGQGMTRMDALRYGDRLVPWNMEQSPASQSSTTATPTPGGLTPPTGRTGSTTGAGAAAATSTGMSTGTTTGRSPRAWPFTTKTTTLSTTTPQTSPSSTHPNTPRIIRSNDSRTAITALKRWSTWRESVRSLWNGTALRKVGNGTANTVLRPTRSGNLNSSPANSAGRSTSPSIVGRVPGSARTSANLRGGVRAVWTILTAPARRVASHSGRTNTASSGAVPVRVLSSFEPLPGRQPVYNLTVDGEHEYFASGVLTHNCDALRYLLQELAGKEYRPKRPAHERMALEAGNRTLTAGVQSASF